jgi:hypothetical protein
VSWVEGLVGGPEHREMGYADVDFLPRECALASLTRAFFAISQPRSLWACFNFFGGGVVGSTAVARIPDFVYKPYQTPQLLGYAMPGAANTHS